MALAAAGLIVGWLVAQSKDKSTGLERVGTTRVGCLLVVAGWGYGLLYWPNEWTWYLPAWWAAGVVLLGAASRHALGWVSAGEVAVEAVRVAWLTPLRVLVTVTALGAGVALQVQADWPHKAVLATAVAFLPAAWWVGRGLRRQATVQHVETALSGLFEDNYGPWDVLHAARRSAPTTTLMRRKTDDIRLITAPIPPTFKALPEKEEEVEIQVQNRLGARDEIGAKWPVHLDRGSQIFTTHRVPPLPTYLELAPEHERPARQHAVTMGRVSVSKRAAAAGLAPYANHRWLVVDWMRSPHHLYVGETGSGKSGAVGNTVTQLARKGWQVHFCDPKTVEASGFAGRQNISSIAVTLDEMRDLVASIRALVAERYEVLTYWGKRLGKKVAKVQDLPKEVQETLAPVLLVVDEIVELLAAMGGASDEAKAVNGIKAEIAAALDSIVRLGRAADVHLLGACQRGDRNILSGQFQNNLSTVSLFNPAGANSTTRTMADLNEVTVAHAGPGRSVVRSIGVPEMEMQGLWVDDSDLDIWLPKVEEVTVSDPDPDALTPVDIPEGADRSLREQEGDLEDHGEDAAVWADEDWAAALEDDE